MSATLVLLALLSIATLASQRGYAAFVAHIVSAPLLLAVGVMLAPSRLAFLSVATTEALLPPLRVGIAWLVLLVGLRALRPKRKGTYGSHLAFTIIVVTGTWLLLSGCAYGIMYVLEEGKMAVALPTSEGPHVRLGIALLLGGLLASGGFSFAMESLEGTALEHVHRQTLFLGRHDDAVGAIAVCIAIWLCPLSPEQAPIYASSYWPFALCILLGIGFAFAFSLLGGNKMGGASASWVALLGLITLASGLCSSILLPEAGLAYFFGLTIALLGFTRHLGHARLAQTTRPVRMVVLVLIGTHLGFSVSAAFLGVGLALSRLGLKALLRAWMVQRSGIDFPFTTLLGASSTALPFVLSFALTRPEPLFQNEILATVAVAVSVTDLMTLLVWRRRQPNPAIADAESSAPLAKEPLTADGGNT